MGTLRNYAFEDTIGILEGRNLSGHGEEGGYSFERYAPPGEVVEGADGEPTFNKSASKGMYVTITCKVNGLAYRDLNELLQAQEADSSLGYSFSFRDPLGGTRLSAGGCKFVDAGELAFGKSAGEQEFKLYL